MREIHVIGLDPAQARLADREAVAVDARAQGALYDQACVLGAGLAVLATCNRVETYVEGTAADAETLRSLWASQTSDTDRSLSALRVTSGRDAVRHLVRVAAGLESAVLGEAQILGQVRRARAEAMRGKALTPPLAEAFAEALAAGRRVRSRTALGQGVASTASAAVALASRALGGLADRHVVVVGGGEIGRLLVKHIASMAPQRLTLVSRSARLDGVECALPEALPGLLATADAVLTGTDRVVITPADLSGRDGAPLAVVDLGAPRNVDAAVADVPGVVLHDVDALATAVGRALELRREAIPAAEALVEAAVEAFEQAAPRLRREALVADIRRRAEQTRRDAVAAAGGHDDLDRLTKTITKRVLHDLTRALRTDVDLTDDVLRRLFALPTDA